MKHIGKYVAGGQSKNVVVAMMNNVFNNETQMVEPGTALVIFTDDLHPNVEKELMITLASQEGQAAKVLREVLDRNLFSIGEPMTAWLHKATLLKKVPVETIVMYPDPSMAIPLPQVLAAMGHAVPAPTPVAEGFEIPAPDVEKYNPHTEHLHVEDADETLRKAKNMLFEASLLDGDAKELVKNADNKREAAYALVPALRPKPVLVEAAVEKPKAVAKTPAKTTTVMKPKSKKTTA